MEQKKPSISKAALYGIMGGMLITGTCNTMILKVQDLTKTGMPASSIEQSNPPYPYSYTECNDFTHPYMQGLFMFVGEFICFGLLGIKRLLYGHENKAKEAETAVPLSPGMAAAVEQKKLTKIHPLWLAIPAACDFTSSTLMFVALTMVPASVY